MLVKYSRTQGIIVLGSCDQSPASLLYIVVSKTGSPGQRTASAVRQWFSTPEVRQDRGLIPAVLAISFAQLRSSSRRTGRPGSCLCSSEARRMVSSSSASVRWSCTDKLPSTNAMSALAASARARSAWSMGEPRMNLTCACPSGDVSTRLSPVPGSSSDISTTSGRLELGRDGCSSSSRKISSVADPEVTAPPSTMMCAFRNLERRYCPLPESISSLSATIADTSEEKNATPLTIMTMAKTCAASSAG